MNFIVYLFVALIAAGSVLFGLGWGTAPMSPMPPSKYEIRAAVPPPPAPVVAEVKPEPKPETKAQAEAKPDVKPAAAPPTALTAPTARPTVAPRPAVPTAALQPSAPLDAADQPPAAIIAAEPGSAAPGTAAAAAPTCNVDACASAYRSFTAADCTYQPSDGPRRLCTKGAPPTAATPVPPSTTAAGTAAPEARAQACNIAACSQSYPRSFSAADCTFQPSDGPRRVCTK